MNGSEDPSQSSLCHRDCDSANVRSTLQSGRQETSTSSVNTPHFIPSPAVAQAASGPRPSVCCIGPLLRGRWHVCPAAWFVSAGLPPSMGRPKQFHGSDVDLSRPRRELEAQREGPMTYLTLVPLACSTKTSDAGAESGERSGGSGKCGISVVQNMDHLPLEADGITRCNSHMAYRLAPGHLRGIEALHDRSNSSRWLDEWSRILSM